MTRGRHQRVLTEQPSASEPHVSLAGAGTRRQIGAVSCHISPTRVPSRTPVSATSPKSCLVRRRYQARPQMDLGDKRGRVSLTTPHGVTDFPGRTAEQLIGTCRLGPHCAAVSAPGSQGGPAPRTVRCRACRWALQIHWTRWPVQCCSRIAAVHRGERRR